MVQLFYGNRSFALMFLPLLVILYSILNVYFPYHEPEATAHFGFWGQILSQSNIVSAFIAPAMVFLGAITLNALFNRNDFMERNNYMVSLLYVTLMSIFHSFYYLDGFGISQVFVILALYQMFYLYQNEDGRRRVFNVGFLLGIASTFYPVLISVVLVAFWLVWVIRPFVMRESLLLMVGFLIPLMYGGMYSSFMGIKIQNAEISSAAFELKIEDILVMGGICFFMILLSFGAISTKIQQSSIRLKKLFRIVLILINFTLFLTAFEYLVFHKKEVMALVFVPLMFVLPYSFGYKKLRDVTTVVYYLMFLFSVGKFLFPLSFLTAE